ncbi:MAG: PAS domain S-box protein [Spirochaetes bacterium]|nr:PAS domain S-box protein [Spirochaetota bacterium]
MNRPYESIVHMIPDIIYKLDAEGNIVYINNSIRNLGYEPAELICKHFSVLIHPEDLGHVQRETIVDNIVLESADGSVPPKLFDERRTGKRITKDLLVRLVPKNYDIVKNKGLAIVAQCRVIAVGSYYSEVEGEGREFTGTLGIIKDIMNVKKSEDTLLRCIDYYQSLVEISNDIFYVLATDGTILYTSQSMSRILGYESDEIAGENIIDYVQPDDLKSVVRSYTATRQGTPIFSIQCRLLGKNGEWFTFEVIGKMIYDEYGRPMYITVITHDVSQRVAVEESLKKAHSELGKRVAERTADLARANEKLRIEIEFRKKQETNLMDSERKYRGLVNSIDVIVLNLDPEGIILFINPAIEKITGYHQEEVIGRNLLEFVHQEDIDRFLYSMKLAPEDGTASDNRLRLIEKISMNNEMRMVRKDGTDVWIEMQCRPVRGPGGAIMGFRGIAQDITRRKQSEEELRRASKIDSLGILAGGIAHDFNNILTAIVGNISLARTNIRNDKESYNILGEAEKAAFMAKNLTQQLLSFSKNGSPVKTTSSIQALLVDTADFVLRGSNIKCEFRIPLTLWDADIDRGQISQVIHNIILNARQVMASGGMISVEAENRTVGSGDELPLKEGNYVAIGLTDQGPGIPDDILKRIFDPYFSTKESGTGLGLTISYSIIKKHDGHITVNSKIGRGTSFTIYLPASRKKAAMRLTRALKNNNRGGRVLIMDDEEIIRDLGGKMLAHLGYDVVLAANGPEAARCFSEAKNSGRPFDLVILDLVIPGGHGGEKALVAIREVDPAIRAIVTSGYADDPVMLEYKKYGFSGSLAKPFNLEELDAELSRVLN